MPPRKSEYDPWLNGNREAFGNRSVYDHSRCGCGKEIIAPLGMKPKLCNRCLSGKWSWK